MATLLEKDFATEMLFDMEHNLSEYNKITRDRYQGASALESYTPMTAEPKFVPVQLDSYTPAPAAEPRQKFVPSGLDSYAPRPMNNAKPSTSMLESYTKLTPVGRSAATFRPELVETESIEIDLPKQIELNYSLITAKYNDDEEEQVESIITEQPQQFVSKLRLNAVGMVAVVSFVAVAIMILAFIIANSVAISSASARIASLQANNASIAASLDSAVAANQALYAERTAEITDYVVGNPNYVHVPQRPIAEAQPWTVASTPSPNTSIFNEVSKFFSRIF